MIVALFPELLSVGGVQLAGRQIAAALTAISRDRGWSFHALSLNDLKGAQESSFGGLKFRFQGFQRNKFRFFLSAVKLARPRPQIVIAAHPNLAPVALSMRFLAGRSRIIVCAHGIEVWRPQALTRSRALRAADVVLAPSADTARKLQEVQHVPEERIQKLPWALDPGFLSFAAAPEKLPLPYDFPQGVVILSVGRWAASERYKGADSLIAVVSELAGQFPDLHLVLAGSGDDVPRLREIANNSRIAQRIHFFTGLSREALAACYSHADIFALPSSGEGFGFVFLEAMAMNKPVIGMDAGGIPDIVGHGETGFLIDPQNPSSLAVALRELISSPELRQKMGQRGGDIVRSHFSFESFQKGLRSILCADEPD